MRFQTTTLGNISREETLRYDVDYTLYQKDHEKNYYMFSELFELLSASVPEEEALYSDFDYCEIGDADKDGEIDPVTLNFNIRNLEDENYYKKIENGNITGVSDENILIAKVRPNLKKYIYISDKNKSVFFTTAFIRLRPKKMPLIMYHGLRTIFYNNLMAIARQGKGYPTISENDIVRLRFDKDIIDTLVAKQSVIEKDIKTIRLEIAELQSHLTSSAEIIDDVFQQVFSISRLEYDKIEKRKLYNSSFSALSARNANIRLSYRWDKAHEFQDYLSAHVECTCLLGEHILSTKNGWSPACNDAEGDYQVLGIDAIQKNGSLSFDAPKFSSEKKSNLDDYIIKQGDFFVSRGNTVDLVSLASIANSVHDEMPTTIYPDLMIRIEFDGQVDKEYMAYVFNSFIGRYFFKYSTKGKNQTMVKVSPQELCAFMVPLPTINEQRRIADMIHSASEEQHKIERQISKLRQQIDQIITDAIA